MAEEAPQTMPIQGRKRLQPVLSAADARQRDEDEVERLTLNAERDRQRGLDAAAHSLLAGDTPRAEFQLRKYADVPEDEIAEQLAAGRAAINQRGFSKIVQHFSSGRQAAKDAAYSAFRRSVANHLPTATSQLADELWESLPANMAARVAKFLDETPRTAKNANDLRNLITAQVSAWTTAMIPAPSAAALATAVGEAATMAANRTLKTQLDSKAEIAEEELSDDENRLAGSASGYSSDVAESSSSSTPVPVRRAPLSMSTGRRKLHATLSERALEHALEATPSADPEARKAARIAAGRQVSRDLNTKGPTLTAAQQQAIIDDGPSGTVGKDLFGYGRRKGRSSKYAATDWRPFGTKYEIDGGALSGGYLRLRLQSSNRPVINAATKGLGNAPPAPVLTSISRIAVGQEPDLDEHDEETAHHLWKLNELANGRHGRKMPGTEKPRKPRARKQKAAPGSGSGSDSDEPAVMEPRGARKGARASPANTRLEILVGEFEAGNDSPEILDEITSLARAAVRAGKISRPYFKDLISAISSVRVDSD